MSVYSNGSVTTKLLEPATYNENVSAEFRISEPCLPNIRLIDVGSKNSQDIQYNTLIGAYGCLRSVMLYSGQMLLDGCPNIAQFVAFKKYNHSNATNRGLHKLMARNQMGFNLDRTGILVDTPVENNQSGTTDALTTLAYIPVSEYCPLLKRLNVLDPLVFQNLRLVLEFDPAPAAFLSRNDSTTTNSRRPRLVMDCLQPGSFQPNPSVTSWNAIEQDRYALPAIGQVAAETIQRQSNGLNGFNSKLVGRMLIVKTFADDSKNIKVGTAEVNGFGRYASHAQCNEEIQVSVNGAQQLPRNGVQGTGNRMLSQLHETWGDCNTIPSGNTLGIATTAKMSADLQEYQGQQSYFGMFVNQRVKDLQIQHTRTGLVEADAAAVTPTNEALNCLVFCEVSKSLVIRGGQVNTIYN